MLEKPIRAHGITTPFVDYSELGMPPIRLTYLQPLPQRLHHLGHLRGKVVVLARVARDVEEAPGEGRTW